MDVDETRSAPGVEERPDEDLRLRQRTTAAVLTRCREMRELADGYALSYPASAAWRRRLTTFRDNWSRGTPRMSFELVPDENGEAIWLEIRGPEGTKEWVDGARYMLRSYLNPAPTPGKKLQRAFGLATSPLRVLPDFLVLGAKKCGTTALYWYLTQHPRVRPAFQKEIHFFTAAYRRGLLWYRSFFPTRLARALAGEPFLTGEATPDYLFHTYTAARIRKALPDARLIAILRNPVDRAYSSYNHNLRAGLESLSFEEALDREEERLARAGGRSPRPGQFHFSLEHHSYCARGVYADQLEVWLEQVPREQLLVLATEELHGRRVETLHEALDFLDLPPWEPGELERMNVSLYPELDADLRRRLEAYFEPHNRRLYELLGRNLGW